MLKKKPPRNFLAFDPSVHPIPYAVTGWWQPWGDECIPFYQNPRRWTLPGRVYVAGIFKRRGDVYALEGPYQHDVEMLAALAKFPVKPVQTQRKTNRRVARRSDP